MIKPYFNEIERMILKEDTFISAQMKLDLSLKKFKREFISIINNLINEITIK